MRRIFADSKTLMDQGPMTADTYMREAIKCIDERFGEGFARENPSLVGQFILASALDFTGSIVAGALEDLSERC